MREGYREMSQTNVQMAEAGLAGEVDILPEW